MKKVTALIPILFLLACDDSPQTVPHIQLKDIRLQRFTSCDAMNALVKKTRDAHEVYYGETVAMPMAGEDAGKSPAGETNLRTAGVDEMDVSKADGNFIYTVRENELLVLKRSPASQLAIVQRLPLGQYASGLFLTSSHAIVLMQEWGTMAGGAEPSGMDQWFASTPDSYSEQIVITEYRRASDGRLSSPVTRKVEGSLSAARMIGERIHLVFSKYLYGSDDVVSELPLTVHSGDSKLLANCTDIYYEPAIDQYPWIYPLSSLTCVTTLDASDLSKDPKGDCVADSSAAMVYASQKNLFLASWGWDGTPVHQFQLETDEGATKYVGSLVAPGEILNHFSIDEFDGHLRLATTSYNNSDVITNNGTVVSSTGQMAATSNQLLVFQLRESDPVLVGAIPGIAPGERIYSARFMGERGFVVTFKKVDPLFAIDLSNPSNPQIRGALKIPGFSSYLEPMKEGYLLAIGKDAEAAQESDDFAWYQGMALSIFDVRDLSSPKLVQKIGIGSRGTDSEALHDQKAFRYVPEENLVIFPIDLYEGGDGQSGWGTQVFSGFQIYDATVENGFHFLGQVAIDPNDYSWSYGGRSFYKDGVVDLVQPAGAALWQKPNQILGKILF